jgi:GNAT superfamily N-acetyltransferase
MPGQHGTAQLRPAHALDEAFLYEVFCTTWAHRVAALPNQNLARHVLRIQHIAQEREFSSRHPDHQKLVVLVGNEPAGRLYLDDDGASMQLLDLTLIPRFRGRGLGSGIVSGVCEQAAAGGRTLKVRVVRADATATGLWSPGFRRVAADDLADHLEWTATPTATSTTSDPGSSRPRGAAPTRCLVREP